MIAPIGSAARAPTSCCTICHRETASWFTVRGYTLFTCAGCDFVFLDPAVAASLGSEAIFNDEYFSGGGAGYTNYLDEARLLRAHGARYGKLLADVGAQRVLDVGAAAGYILRGLIDAGCNGVGVEPNASMVAHAAGELGLDVRATTLEQFETAERFDAVAMLQVVDHLDDVRLSFANVRALTERGGWCLVEFGNRASLTARVLASAWHEYAPPSVRRVFSLNALRRLVGEYGFALHAWGRPAKYVRADHALSLLRYKANAPFARAVVSLVARAVPADATLQYPGDDIVWALFRKL